MIRSQTLSALASRARLATAVCTCLVSVRLTWMTILEVQAFFDGQASQGAAVVRQRKAFASAAAPVSGPVGAPKERPMNADDVLALSAASASTSAPAAELPKKPEVRTLLVQLGPPRSEVIVNGRRLGETPFAGQWSCVDGDRLKIQIVPREGVPIERALRCGGATLLVQPRQSPRP